jgi:hypothetical protein
MILTFRPATPLPHWQPADADRPYSPFSATYAATLEVLDRELYYLDAREAFLQVVASERDVRLDGQLRADARVDHPGVILTIDTRRLGTVVYETDRYQSRSWRGRRAAGWQENLRAIALGLEALRKVERYGIANRGQQYAGFRELGSGIAAPAALTLEEAARLLMPDDPDWLLEVGTEDDVADRYRWLAKTAHPDHGGDAEAFRRLTSARDALLEEVRRR